MVSAIVFMWWASLSFVSAQPQAATSQAATVDQVGEPQPQRDGEGESVADQQQQQVAWWQNIGDVPRSTSSAAKRRRHPDQLSEQDNATDSHSDAEVPNLSEASVCSACDDDDDASDDELQTTVGVGKRTLWDSRAVYPAGQGMWRDHRNCTAATEYECPCGNRCLHNLPNGSLSIYEHRKQLRCRAVTYGAGGLRDVSRLEMTSQYDRPTMRFQQTFNIDGKATCCIWAYGVASGLSEATFTRARSDVTKNKPMRPGRVVERDKRESSARRTLRGWIELQKHSMEGDKRSGDKWYTEKTSEKQLWRRYEQSCDDAKVPTVGSSRLLWDEWKAHPEIIEQAPTGHDICDTCADFRARGAALQGLTGEQATADRAQLHAEIAAHKSFYGREQNYDDLAHTRAIHDAGAVTAIMIDAPTQHQFDLPSQARGRRDAAKKLDGKQRWGMKIEGVFDSGVGMLIYAARAALGGGANLICTVLLLTLMHHVHQTVRPLGRCSAVHLVTITTTFVFPACSHSLLHALVLKTVGSYVGESEIFRRQQMPPPLPPPPPHHHHCPPPTPLSPAFHPCSCSCCTGICI